MDGKWNAGTSGHQAAPVSSAMRPVNVEMEEQSRRFALNSSQPVTGKLHISDGKVHFHGNNLKPGGSGYKLFFIGRKNSTSVYKIIANIIPDMHGSAQLECTINPADIDGEGTDLSCFYIFMVAAMSRPLQPVLKGDLVKHETGRADSINRHINHTKSARPARTFNSYYSEYILDKFTALEARNVEFTIVSPFDDAWLTDNWKRVTDLMKLPIASVGAEIQSQKYGHFIYGSAEEHFYLAVPGRHTEEEWPDRGCSGFMLWQSIRGSDEYGYWAMVIDRRTGIISAMD